MKIKCSNCNKQLGFLSSKTELKDGILCSNCIDAIEKVGMCDLEDRLNNIPLQKFKEIYEKKKYLAQIFETDFQFGNMLIIDNTNKLFVIDGVLLQFDNLENVEVKFQYSETSTSTAKSKTKKGIGKSLLGGLLFGSVGALVGGMTTKGKTSSSTQTNSTVICSSCKIILTLKNYYIPKHFINIENGNDEITETGCNCLEDYGNLLETELKQILNKKGEKND